MGLHTYITWDMYFITKKNGKRKKICQQCKEEDIIMGFEDFDLKQVIWLPTVFDELESVT
jgi:hypothetical protein